LRAAILALAVNLIGLLLIPIAAKAPTLFTCGIAALSMLTAATFLLPACGDRSRSGF
jgi:hypothetical protein